MKTFRVSDLSKYEVDKLKPRPRTDYASFFSKVLPIVDDVRVGGDAAIKERTFRLNNVRIDKIVEISSELPNPELDSHVQKRLDVAYDKIYAFHAAQNPVENTLGVKCKRLARGIDSVGLYVPGGKSVLPSTVLMLSVPAQIAGCKIVVLATPPSKDGSISKEVLYCAKKAGVTHILKAGGPQAISAMVWGTESCPKVEKIYGPGNQYATAAKMILQNSVRFFSINMPAGPLEVLVIADKFDNPVLIAADLLSQAEHGPDSQVLVVAGDGVDVCSIYAEIDKQRLNLPRGDFSLKALNHSFTVIARDMVEAINFSNDYAPEHLMINVKNAEKWESSIKHAGSVFLGHWTPKSVGSYASGTDHLLPMYGGVYLNSFLIQRLIMASGTEQLIKIGDFRFTVEICVICQEKVSEPSILLCLHTFCYSCIKEWSKHSTECPHCREPFSSVFHEGKEVLLTRRTVSRPSPPEAPEAPEMTEVERQQDRAVWDELERTQAERQQRHAQQGQGRQAMSSNRNRRTVPDSWEDSLEQEVQWLDSGPSSSGVIRINGNTQRSDLQAQVSGVNHARTQAERQLHHAQQGQAESSTQSSDLHGIIGQAQEGLNGEDDDAYDGIDEIAEAYMIQYERRCSRKNTGLFSDLY